MHTGRGEKNKKMMNLYLNLTAGTWSNHMKHISTQLWEEQRSTFLHRKWDDGANMEAE